MQAYIVGEHGDSSVALWSSISVGGVPVLSFLEKQQIAYEKETLENIHKAVIDSAYEVISLKGYTSWAIGYSAASLARSILRNQRRIHPVSVLAKGFYGIEGGDVFLSLPAQLGRGGILGVTNVHLTDEEAQRLRDSAKTILEVQNQLGLWGSKANSCWRILPFSETLLDQFPYIDPLTKVEHCAVMFLCTAIACLFCFPAFDLNSIAGSMIICKKKPTFSLPSEDVIPAWGMCHIELESK